MAIARGAGTEIIRSAWFEDVNNTRQDFIVGVAHHIYTILSMVFFCNARAGTEKIWVGFIGYDSKGGTVGEYNNILQPDIALNETFVWNDKFSFNGFGPANFTGPMDDAIKQDAIADQGGAAQYLYGLTASSSTTFDVTITYIDQNNA